MVSFPSYVNLPKGRERLIQQFTLYIYMWYIYICVYTYCVMVYGSLLLIISNQWLLIIIINQTIYSNEQAHVWPYALHSFNEFLHGEGFSESVVIPLPTCRCMTVDLHWTLLLELVCVCACMFRFLGTLGTHDNPPVDEMWNQTSPQQNWSTQLHSHTWISPILLL